MQEADIVTGDRKLSSTWLVPTTIPKVACVRTVAPNYLARLPLMKNRPAHMMLQDVRVQ
jgi:hypothetical protein